jgi:lipopolysaccharide biosynthesis glycosyltransferase
MDNLIFICVSNYGAIELTKNHLTSLRQNGIDNYMAYVTDNESYNELTSLGFNATLFDTITIEKHKMIFGNNDYNYMTYIRYYVIHKLLEEGKKVWYLDVDTVALINLNIVYETLDKSLDIYFQNDINMLCTGCFLIFPNNKTIQLIMCLIKNQNYTNNDQIMMNQILKNNENIFNIDILPKENFPNGLLYFNELSDNLNFRKHQMNFKNSKEPHYFVHANFMVGIDVKMEALKNKQLWFI